MRSFFLAAASALVASVAAFPEGKLETRTTSNCMSDSAATTVANNFKTLIASYSDSFANQTLTTDFQDYSDSVIELINSGCAGPVAVCKVDPCDTSDAETRCRLGEYRR
jgi:hypothetical protein